MALGRGTSVGRVGWRSWPFGGDDSVELRPQQFLVGQHQIEEPLIGAAVVVEAVGLQGRGHPSHPRAQALMAWLSSLSRVIEILRGLARSATGIVRVSTPAS